MISSRLESFRSAQRRCASLVVAFDHDRYVAYLRNECVHLTCLVGLTSHHDIHEFSFKASPMNANMGYRQLIKKISLRHETSEKRK